MSEREGAEAAATLPWSRSCFVCGQDNPHGLRLRSRVEGDLVVLEHTARDADRGWRHIMHGGITMTLLDETMTWAAILRARRACVAARMETRFKRPIPVGCRIRVEGRVTAGRGGRLFQTEGRALDEEGRELATATGMYVPMPADQASPCAEDFVVAPGVLDPAMLMAP